MGACEWPLIRLIRLCRPPLLVPRSPGHHPARFPFFLFFALAASMLDDTRSCCVGPLHQAGPGDAHILTRQSWSTALG